MQFCKYWLKDGDDRVSVLLCADDVIVMSESAQEQQELLDAVNGYGRDFGEIQQWEMSNNGCEWGRRWEE